MLSALRSRAKVENILLLMVLIFGSAMILLIPPGAGYDEEDHLVRVWELSIFSLIPGRLSPHEMKYPTMFRDLAYRQQANSGIIDSDFWKRYARTPLYEHGFIRRELKTKSVYSPALLLPQAIVMRLGRTADAPALPVFYACRFAGLLSYLLLIWLALRGMPFGKWILLVLAISPMALFQAATVTPDAISNGIGFLFIAGILKLADSKEIGWKESGTLVLLVFLLFLAKVNLTALILLPFLLILPARFTQKRIYLLLLGITAILFLVEVAGWNLVATSHSDALSRLSRDGSAALLDIHNGRFKSTPRRAGTVFYPAGFTACFDIGKSFGHKKIYPFFKLGNFLPHRCSIPEYFGNYFGVLCTLRHNLLSNRIMLPASSRRESKSPVTDFQNYVFY